MEHRKARRAVLLVLVSASALAGVAVGSSLVPASPSSDWLAEEAPDELSVRPGSRSIERIVPDLEGGLPWALQVGTSRTGGMCFYADRIKSGRFGRLAPDGRFVARAEGPTDSCGDVNAGGSRDPARVLASSHDGVLLIYGAAGPLVKEIQVGGEPVTLSPRRGFLAVRAGVDDDLLKYPVTAVLNDGNVVLYPWDGPPRAG